MLFDLLYCFVVLAAIAASTPLWLLLIYAVLRLIPKTRKLMEECEL